MGFPLSSVIGNVHMDNFETVALEQSNMKPNVWLMHMNGKILTFSLHSRKI